MYSSCCLTTPGNRKINSTPCTTIQRSQGSRIIEDIRYSTVQGKSPIDAAAMHFTGGKQGDIL